MAPPNTLVNKLKVQLKMAIQRLRMHQSKSTAIAKQQRRHMAELLAENKLESARIRVEGIIRSDITSELHEILELYCELLLARIQLLEAPYVPPAYLTAKAKPTAPTPSSSTSVAARLSAVLSGQTKQPEAATVAPTAEPEPEKTSEEPTTEQLINLPDAGLVEAILAILYAAPRLGPDIKELSTARALLLDKLGKDTAIRISTANEADAASLGVPERVLKRLSATPPSSKLVDGYLREIGRTYGVRWPGEPDPDDVDNDGDGGGVKESIEVPEFEDDEDDGDGAEKPIALTTQELSKATPPRDVGTVAPLRIAPPSPSTENVAPKIKLPPAGSDPPASPLAEKKAQTPAPAAKKTPGGGAKSRPDGPGGKVPDVDELSKRFEALKRL